jgi:hypothetical protein
MNGRRAAHVALILAVALTLAGCARKGDPTPPKDESAKYPRTYPSE